jgi:purine-cytosine permease-like protein
MPSIRFRKRSVKLPDSRVTRVALGGAFIAGGVFSFLPVLGIWMLPIGLVILSHDFPRIRRFRRQWEVKLSRRWARFRGKPTASTGRAA